MATVKPPLMPPLYDGHFFLRTVHTFTLVSTSLLQPLLWGTVHTFTLVSTSLLQPLLWGTVHTFTLVSTSLQRPLFWRTVHTFTLVSTSLQRPLFWRTVHTFTLVSTSLQWLPLFNGHLTFLADSPYIHSCCNLPTMATSLHSHFHLPPKWPL